MYDSEIVNWLLSHTIPHSIPVLQGISSSTTYISIFLTLALLTLSIVKRSKQIRNKFFMLAAVLILVAGVSQGLKAVITRDRPFETHSGIEKLSEAGGSSFPSGHTMEAFAVATALSLLFSRKRVVIPIFIWAALVAYSRMALGVHYPSDVFAGIVIGVFIGWIVPWISRRFFPSADLHP